MADSLFLLKNETHHIIGSAMEVLNVIDHGLHEKIYENALVVEFRLRHIPVIKQPDFPVNYKSVNVGSYVPDLICFAWSSSMPRQSRKSPTTKLVKC